VGSIVYLLIGCASAMAGTAAVDQTVGVATDVAGLFVYHPDDLKHRQTSPDGWVYTDFACGREFNAGTLIAFSTGGDGGYDLRLTDGDLTPRERPLVGNSYSFRYRVQHGRVYVDGGNFLPSDSPYKNKTEKIPESRGVAMPNGDYEVRVVAINRPDDDGGRGAGQRLPDYVLQFRKVKKLSAIPVLSPVPLYIANMRPGEPIKKEPPSYLDFEEDLSHPLDESYLALVSSPGYILRKDGGFRDADRALFDAIRRRVRPPERSIRLVVLESESVPAVGTLVEADVLNDFQGPKPSVRIGAIRQVKVNELTRRGPLLEVEVAPLTRPRSKVLPADLAAVKAEFAAFAKADAEYRKTVKNPDYEAERVEAVGSPSALTNILLHHVPLSAERRQALLRQSDLERIRGLRAAMKEAK
jgi:hypothetical protein